MTARRPLPELIRGMRVRVVGPLSREIHNSITSLCQARGPSPGELIVILMTYVISTFQVAGGSGEDLKVLVGEMIDDFYANAPKPPSA